ncbi:MAG: hypothetical protein WCE49_09180 [Terrimicrobiaceae bacterium]
MDAAALAGGMERDTPTVAGVGLCAIGVTILNACAAASKTVSDGLVPFQGRSPVAASGAVGISAATRSVTTS